jgi:hypothetical protein
MAGGSPKKGYPFNIREVLIMDYQKLNEQVMADERYQKNIEYEYDRPQ